MKVDDFIKLRSYFAKNSRIKEFSGYGGKIHTLGWNSAGTKLASGSSDKMVNIYVLESTRLVCFHNDKQFLFNFQSKLQSFHGHNGSVDQLCWHPTDNEVVATVSADGFVRLWDSRSSKCPVSAQLKGENINLAWSPDARYIAVGSKTDLVSAGN